MELQLGDKLKELFGMVEGVGKATREVVGEVTAVGKAAASAVSLKDSPEWGSHAYVDQEKTKPHMMEWAGGYNRKSRNAGSFYGGYDAATRWPDKAEELKTLAKGYQMGSALKDHLQTTVNLLEGAIKNKDYKKIGDFKDEMEDALANISGIEAAQRDMQEGKRYSLGEDLDAELLSKAKQYAETYTNKE